jgi:hypothetical protein
MDLDEQSHRVRVSHTHLGRVEKSARVRPNATKLVTAVF